MKTDMEKSMECVVNIFHQYAILNPSDDYIQSKEFHKLMTEQAQPFLRDTLPPNTDVNAYIEKLFKKADKGNKGKLKFTEFMTALAPIFADAHHRAHKLDGDGHGHGHGHSHDGHGHGHSHDDHGHGHGPVSSGH